MSTVVQETITASTDSDNVESESTEPEKKSSSREYVIFEQRSQKTWEEVKRVNAPDVETALESLGSSLKQTSKYVAVAERYWKPAKPTVETHTTISLSFE